MSPRNHLLTMDQISVWYIPSVNGADTGMYFHHTFVFNTLVTFIHSCICYTFGAQCGALVTIVDYGDFWNLNPENYFEFEINLNFKLNIEILLWQGGIRADEPLVINQPFTYIPTHLISAWCCPTRQHLCVGDPCVYTAMKLSPAGLGTEVVKREVLHSEWTLNRRMNIWCFELSVSSQCFIINIL